jgi:predicted nucleic acid-binding protein
MKTSIDIPDELFQPAKARASLSGISLRQFVTDTWIAAIARHRKVPVISHDGHFDAVSGIERVSW